MTLAATTNKPQILTFWQLSLSHVTDLVARDDIGTQAASSLWSRVSESCCSARSHALFLTLSS